MVGLRKHALLVRGRRLHAPAQGHWQLRLLAGSAATPAWPHALFAVLTPWSHNRPQSLHHGLLTLAQGIHRSVVPNLPKLMPSGIGSLSKILQCSGSQMQLR